MFRGDSRSWKGMERAISHEAARPQVTDQDEGYADAFTKSSLRWQGKSRNVMWQRRLVLHLAWRWVFCNTSIIYHLSSIIHHLSSIIHHPSSSSSSSSSNVKRQTSNVKDQTSNIKHHQISAKVIKHQQTSLDIMKYREISWNIVKYHEISSICRYWRIQRV